MRSLITAPRLFTGLDRTFVDRGAVLVEGDRIVAAGRENDIGGLEAPATAWWRMHSTTMT